MAHLKGHKSLAEMVSTHTANWREAMEGRKHFYNVTMDKDSADYWQHELDALTDIERAIAIELGRK